MINYTTHMLDKSTAPTMRLRCWPSARMLQSEMRPGYHIFGFPFGWLYHGGS